MLYRSVILIIMLLMPRIIFSASVAIFITDLSDYPEIHANIFFLDDNGNQLFDISGSDVQIIENGEIQNITNYSCTPGTTPSEISSILSVDVSASMDVDKIKNAKDALNIWIDNLPIGSEVSISSFNKHNYMLRDFTSDKQLLTNSLNFMSGNGGTDFDNAFFGQPAGIFLTAGRAQHIPIVVLYTDGEGNADTQSIIDSANLIGAKVYSFVTSEVVPSFLLDIADQTGGKTFGRTLENNDVQNAYKYILADAQGLEPCSISWISTSCAEEKDIEIRVNSKNIVQQISFKIPSNLLPGFEYPQTNTVDFGEIPIGNKNTRQIKIKAVREDIRIDTIKSNNSQYKIDLKNISFPLTITKDDTKIFDIVFHSVSEEYSLAQFEIESDACINDVFYAIAGGKITTVKDSLLKITFPNGNEKLIAGTDTLITWEGISFKDTVAIEYSTNGTDWNLISQYADGFKYKWQVPFDISNNCVVRLRHTNTSIESGNNYIIDAHNSRINKVVWGRNDFDTVYTASKDGTLKKWYYRYKKENLILTGETNVFDITKNSNERIGTITTDQRVKIYNTSTNELLAEYGHVSGINAMDWSNDSRFIIGGSNSGHILVWKPSDKTNEIAIEKLHNSKVVDLCWNLSSNKIASCDADGKIVVSELIAESDGYRIQEIASFPQYPYPINSLEWVSDEKIAVAAENSEVKIWDINQESSPVSYLRNDIEENILDIDYNSVQKILTTAGSINGVRVFDLSQNRFSYQPYYKYDGHSAQVTAVSIRFDGTVVASADAAGSFHVWKIGDDGNEYVALQDDISDAPFSIVRATMNVIDIDFGKQLKDYTVDSLLTGYIQNTNAFPVKIDSVVIRGANRSSFNLQSKYEEKYLLPNEKIDLLIESVNDQSGNMDADLVVYYNSLNTQAKIKANVIEDKLHIVQDYFFVGKSNLDTTISKSIELLINNSDNNINIESINLSLLNTDRFNLESISNNILSPGDTLFANVKFLPQELGLITSAIDIKTNYFDQNIIILIGGEGTAPQIEVIDNFKFNDVICELSASDSIKIKNTGNGELILKSLSFGTGNYSSNLDLYHTVLPQDSVWLPIQFQSEDTGLFLDTLIISSNLNQNFSTKNSVSISALKESSMLALESSTLEFKELDENQSDIKVLRVYNTGTKSITWSLPLATDNFEVVSITPIITSAGDSSDFEIRFNGGVVSKSPYNEKLIVNDLCGRNYSINLIATIGNNDARIEEVADINLPTLVCSESGKRAIEIKNTGTTPLILTSLNFKISDNIFSFAEDYSGTVIGVNSSKIIDLNYSAKEPGNYSNIVTIETNAVNVPNGELSFEVDFIKEKIEIESSELSVNISGLIQNQSATYTVELKNTGSLAVNSLSYSNLNRFQLVNPPHAIEDDEVKNLIIKFTGGNLGITYNEELYITDDCGKTIRLTLSASVDKIPNAKLTVKSASAFPGQEFKLPFLMTLDEPIEISDATTISFLLSFNSSILLPEDGFISSIESGNKSIVVNNISVKDLLIGIQLPFKAFLGDTNFTEITISEISVDGNDEILVASDNGTFNLLGVCSEGGNRFIIDTGELQLFQNAPNPVYTSSKISFYAIETGTHIVSIYDTYGIKLKEVFNKSITPGYYETTLHAGALASGSYIYILETPSRTIKRKLQVLR